MTKDEILNMPAGRALNMLIAEKVMGWKKIAIGGVSWYLREGPPGMSYQNMTQTGDFAPSEDIAAAFQVVENLHSKYRFELSEYTTPELGRHFRARFYQPRATAFSSDVFFIAPAYNPATAICRAALLAVMDGKQ